MTLHVYDNLAQRSDEWHQARRGIVTASIVGQLLTPTGKVANNDTSRGLTATLVAERITGTTEPNYISDDMWRGIESEPVARDLYAKHHAPVTEVGFMVLERDGWRLGYSPDGLVGDDGLIEVKSPRAKTHVRTILAGEVPQQHMAQLQAGLLVSGRAWVDFISYCGGLPFWVKRVEPDQDWFDAITTAVEQFEESAAEQVATFRTATADLPPTERIDFDDIKVA